MQRHAGQAQAADSTWEGPVAPALLVTLSLLAVILVPLLVSGVLSQPFGVVSGVPQLVTTLVWPVTALLTTYAWANGRALEESADGATSPR